MSASIAIVGMACRYPDAPSVADLWQNVLAGRRAFRRLPAQRLRLADYYSDDRAAPDRTYSTHAAVIEDATFDRASYRISGPTFRSTDPAHWLALDVARQALADGGFPDGRGLLRDTTGVLLGNTLTGDFSRAASLRLRWPYVRRVLASALRDEGCASDRETLLRKVEQHFKEPFAAVTEETLAGGLSNTIAGRICNYFNLRGGGYTVDGACASSLLAVANACSALAAGDLDIALAGGVDLSLDPFELIGFAKTGALARDRMRVYDAHPQGFWPGEGCGFVVLMRAPDAEAMGRHIYSIIRGWGISSDGSGGLTRPEVDGQLLALTRAYTRAAVSPGSVAYFEGHGTGTPVGDVTELRALARARRDPSPAQEPAVIGTIKGNIGHTKAAAGIAGLIKASLAIHEQILPPTTGCDEPHPELSGTDPALKILRQAQVWPSHLALRAGVSSMGFGGINTHVVLDGAAAERRTTLSDEERRCARSPQDAELFVFDAESERQLRQDVEHWSTVVEHLSEAELSDVGAALQRRLRGHRIRAAIVASTPGQFAERFRSLSRALCDARENGTFLIDAENGIFFNVGSRKPRIAFVFPGQGSPTYLTGGAWARRFAAADDVCRRWSLPESSHPLSTATAQPAIVRASLVALRVLESVGLSADVAIGHSLGELTTLHWAGTLDDASLMDLATARGTIMADLPHDEGAMAMVAAPSDEVEHWLTGTRVVIAAVNAPRQTVISGQTRSIADMVSRLRAAGIHASTLAVSGAFHSPLMQPAVPRLAEYLAHKVMRPGQRHAISTITGSRLHADEDIAALLIRQLTSPVRFLDAVRALPPVDLALEVGPGRVLTGILKEITDIPAVALDAAGSGIAGLLHAIGAAFVLGVPVQTHSIWDDRFTRSFDLPWTPAFFINPCERAPVEDAPVPVGTRGEMSSSELSPSDSHPDSSVSDPLRIVRELAARRSELPVEQVAPAHRLLSDLHLNSITVGELVAAAARRLRITSMPSTLELADATIAEVAAVLAAAATGADPRGSDDRMLPAGVDPWVRCFSIQQIESDRPRRTILSGNSGWSVAADSNHPLAHQLARAFATIGGSGIVVCVPRSPTLTDALRLVEAARAAVRGVNGTKFVAVQHGGGASALAKTLFLEAPWVPTVVVDVPVDDPRAPDWILAEAIAAEGFSEVRYGSDGRRTQPVLQRLDLPDADDGVRFDPADVVIVTGGGKGIAAECARALGKETGVRLALLGRSDPARDSTLAMNLQRMKAAGVRAEYVSADVTDPEAVRAAMRAITASLGTPTAILHGAGHNTPQLLAGLDEPTLRATIAPKIEGARNLLAAIDTSRLKWFVVFGSLTAHTGLRGNAHYALANEWLRQFTIDVQAKLPHCRCVAIEWSLWAGVGMGERIGHLDALLRQGLSPIMPDQGIAVLRRLLATPLPSSSVIVAGRIAATPTLQTAPATLPFLRFIEKPRVHYAGIELVADAELSSATDPYVEDHTLSGERLLPAVVGLEAMAQAAMAVTGDDRPPGFESVAFHRPVTIAESGSTTVRIAALVRAPGSVDVSIRSATTGFQTDHFTARCRFPCPCGQAAERDTDRRSDEVNARQLPLDPDRDLYGALLFQRGRFQRLGGYRRLQATECLAEIRPGQSDPWFARYLPGRLVLGDPGARDAAIHALQSCVPHARLIPTGIGSVDFTTGGAEARFVRARETHRDGRVFTFDLDMLAADGRVVEHWTGLQLQQIGDLASPAVWPLPLLAPYLERRVHELDPKVMVKVAVDAGTPERRPRSSTVIARLLLGDDTLVQWRPDGRPETANGIHLSVAHSEQITIAVAADSTVACDVQAVGERSRDQWNALLDDDRRRLVDLVARHTTDDWSVCATRVWTATECLAKAGAMISTPLLLLACRPDGWVKLGSATSAVETFVGRVHPSACRIAIAILVQCEHAHV